MAETSGMSGSVLALDLGTKTGWALKRPDGVVMSGTENWRPSRYEGGGMCFLRFVDWLDLVESGNKPIVTIFFEEVRRHVGTSAAHAYGGYYGHLASWAERRGIPYVGVPVGTIKRHATGSGSASKDAVVAAVKSAGHVPVDDNAADAIALLRFATGEPPAPPATKVRRKSVEKGP